LATEAASALRRERHQLQRLREDGAALATRYAALEGRAGSGAGLAGGINEVLETEVAELHRALRCRACNQRTKVWPVARCRPQPRRVS